MNKTNIKQKQESQFFLKIRINQEIEKKNKLEQEIHQLQMKQNLKKEEDIKNKKDITQNPVFLQDQQYHNIEHRICLLKKKKNDAFLFNQKIRDKINSLRIEKTVYTKFNEVCNKQIQQSLQDLTESKQNNEEVKGELNVNRNELIKLKQKAFTNQKEFEKQQIIIFNHLQKQNQEDHLEEVRQSENVTDKNIQQESKQLIEYQRQIPQKSFQIQKVKLEISHCEDIYKSLQKQTGKDDIEGIIEYFDEKEVNNQSLFIYIQALNNEIEKLQMEYSKARQSLEFFLKNDKNQLKIAHTEDLQKKYEDEKKKLKQCEEKKQNINMTFKSLRLAIPVLLKRIGCDSKIDIDVSNINFKEEICDQNILEYLELIQNKTNEILFYQNENLKQYQQEQKSIKPQRCIYYINRK